MSAELELEQRAIRLEGETLVRVCYQRPRLLDGIRAGAALHPIEHRLVFDFASGTKVAIDYSNELSTRHGFGVSLRELRVVDPAYGPIEDVGDTPRWAPLVGRAIARARIVWDDVRDRLRGTFAIGVAIHSDYLTRRDFPSALELAIGDTRVLIAAARLAADGTIVPYANELLVSFG